MTITLIGGFVAVIGVVITLHALQVKATNRNTEAIERVAIAVSRIEGYIEGKEGRPYVTAAKRNATDHKRP